MAQENALGVDVHDLVPLLHRGIHHVVGAVDAGVIHQDVELAEAGYDLVHRRVPRVLVGHVQPDEHALAARFVNLGLDLPSLFLQNVADDDLGPLAGE